MSHDFLGADNSPPRTATNSMPSYINHVHCSGEEQNLLDCSYSRNHGDNDHSKDVGVKCKKGKFYTFHLLKKDHDVVKKQFNCILKAFCDDGDLRLVGGESESAGLLEVCFSQRWGTINGDGWTSSDTQVACRQLGFEGAEHTQV